MAIILLKLTLNSKVTTYSNKCQSHADCVITYNLWDYFTNYLNKSVDSMIGKVATNNDEILNLKN